MPVSVGSTDITTAYLGSTALSKIYAGAEQIWPAVATCTDVLAEPFNNLSAWAVSGGPPVIVAGRTGTAVQMSNSGWWINWGLPGASESDTITVGVAYRTNSIAAAPTVMYLMSDSGATIHNAVNVVAGTGKLNVSRSTSGSIAQSTGTVIAINTWHYIEVQVKLHDTAGFVKARVDGVEVINATGLDTKNGGTKTTYDSISLRHTALSTTALWDDLYISTGQGCGFKGSITIP